ncbi:MAG: HAD family hydrolase [Alphaproteobacteria bacterium]
MSLFPPTERTTMPDAVFFDWDGTLVDSYQVLSDAHNGTLRALGMPLLEEGAYRAYFGKDRQYIFSSIYKDKAQEATSICVQNIMANNHKIKPIKGAKEVLSFLQNQGVTLGLVTNKQRSFLEKELKYTGFSPYLPTIVASAEAEADKPSAAPLLLALDKAGLDPEREAIWYIGDTESDLLCARDARCKSGLIGASQDTKDLILKYEPFISFDNYSSFRDFLVAI